MGNTVTFSLLIYVKIILHVLHACMSVYFIVPEKSEDGTQSCGDGVLDGCES